MSNTRHADEGPLRQERFCSSAEFERGLMANLVAKRCDLLSTPEERALIWFLQYLSWTEKGLKGLVAELLETFPDLVGTPAMRRFRLQLDTICSCEQVRAIRAELPAELAKNFPLAAGDFDRRTTAEKGRMLRSHAESLLAIDPRDEWAQSIIRNSRPDPIYPSTYPAKAFIGICYEQAKENLGDWLTQLCLNPAESFGKNAPYYFSGIYEALQGYMSKWIERRRKAVVVTELGRQVYETLDYAMQSRCMVLVDGLARTGKTFSAKAWCEEHAGQVRYVQVPSTTDEAGFFRAIARSLGVSINMNSKAHQLRDRIEDVLHRGHLMLVFDEAHYLWPQSNYRHALPGRVNWIMTALVNNGVPVALITTPQFIRTQKVIEERSSWTAEQFTGRIGHYQNLPDRLDEDDLKAVAMSLLPEGDERSIEFLVAYAQASAKYLAGIEAVVRRARFLASRAGRQKVLCDDIKAAIKQGAIASDRALADAVQAAQKPSRRSSGRVAAISMQQVRNDDLPADAGAPDLTASRSVEPVSSPEPFRRRNGGELVTS